MKVIGNNSTEVIGNKIHKLLDKNEKLSNMEWHGPATEIFRKYNWLEIIKNVKYFDNCHEYFFKELNKKGKLIKFYNELLEIDKKYNHEINTE